MAPMKIQRLDLESRSYRIHLNGVEWYAHVTLIGTYHDVGCEAASNRTLEAITEIITEDAIKHDLIVDSSEINSKGKKVFVERRIKVKRGE